MLFLSALSSLPFGSLANLTLVAFGEVSEEIMATNAFWDRALLAPFLSLKLRLWPWGLQKGFFKSVLSKFLVPMSNQK